MNPVAPTLVLQTSPMRPYPWLRSGVVALAAVLGLAILVGCSSSSPPTPEAATEIDAPAATVPVVPPPVEPAAEIGTTADVSVEQKIAAQIFFPKDPESLADPTALFPVEREMWQTYYDDEGTRLEYLLRFWTEGPFGPELEEGFIAPVVLDSCFTPSTVAEFVGETVVVSLCGQLPREGGREDAVVAESFRQTMAAGGFPDAALLDEGGQRCFGNTADDAPLSCLTADVIAALGPGVPCPTNGWQQRFTVRGVQDSVNGRVGRDLTSTVVRQFELGHDVYVYEANRAPGDGYTWVTVQLPDSPRCVYVASDFVVIADGRPPAGIGFDLPTAGTWWMKAEHRLAQGETRTTWTQEDAFYTAVSIETDSGTSIDDYISDQEAEFERGSNEVLIEVSDYTIRAGSHVYIEDYPDAPIEELQAFVDSITIDREAFLAGQ